MVVIFLIQFSRRNRLAWRVGKRKGCSFATTFLNGAPGPKDAVEPHGMQYVQAEEKEV